jgi:DNA alkylation damage repair protein AlkB
MDASKDGILRENERLLRRCLSVERASRLVPNLIMNSDSERLETIGQDEKGFVVSKLSNVTDSVYLIRSYFSEPEILEMASEILERLIDSPPHSNNFSTLDNETGLWNEYIDSESGTKRLKKLRWSCVGYHYDWGSRSYDKSKKSQFPRSFERAYKKVLSLINHLSGSNLNGDPESAIINFYHAHRVSDRLGGHRDDVESTDKTPLVSISLGLPGLFLIDTEAILLNSGDVLVMAENARQSLHGVPCIIGKSRRSEHTGSVSQFLSNTRISISIRQVYYFIRVTSHTVNT